MTAGLPAWYEILQRNGEQGVGLAHLAFAAHEIAAFWPIWLLLLPSVLHLPMGVRMDGGVTIDHPAPLRGRIRQSREVNGAGKAERRYALQQEGRAGYVGSAAF